MTISIQEKTVLPFLGLKFCSRFLRSAAVISGNSFIASSWSFLKWLMRFVQLVWFFLNDLPHDAQLQCQSNGSMSDWVNRASTISLFVRDMHEMLEPQGLRLQYVLD